jgi:hydrogenase maturation protease
VTAGPGEGAPAGPILVVGLGHPDRGDDGVGLAVARQAARLLGDGVTVLEQQDPAGLLDTWAGARLVVVTDAVRSGRRPPGTVQVLHACHGPLPVRTGAGGTHGFGLAEVIELGRALGRMPPELVIVGVEAQQFQLGEPLSPQVAAAVQMAAQTVADVVHCA